MADRRDDTAVVPDPSPGVPPVEPAAPAPAPAPAPARRPGVVLWAPGRRGVTTGLILLITVAAFEAMSVGTAMPTIVAELHGQAYYSWPFSAFLAATVIGTVVGGRSADRRGPARALLAGPGLFLAGLVVAGTAGSMAVLLAGRALQGAGAGTMLVAVYVLVAQVYPESERPVVFGATSAAWVLPSLLGPPLAGLATEHLGWQWVFLGLIPLVVVACVALLPVLLGMRGQAGELAARGQDGAEHGVGRTAAAIGAAAGVTMIGWAAQHPSWPALAGAVAAVAVLVPSLRTVLPAGTLGARRGLPAVVAGRGLLAGAFFGVESFVPLTLTALHHASPTMAGLPLTVGAIGWSAASAWQARHPELARPVLVRRGFLVLAGSLAAVSVAVTGLPGVLLLPVWTLAGAAMGLAYPSISVLVLGLAEADHRGRASASAQLADTLTSSLTVSLGGVLLLAFAVGPAVLTLTLLMAGLAGLGALVAGRTAVAPRP
jgi:MFS family permease